MQSRLSYFFAQFLCLFSVSLSYLSGEIPETEKVRKVLLGIIIQNNDALIPAFLKSIEKLDLEDNDIFLEMVIFNDNPQIWEEVEKWIEKNQDFFAHVTIEFHDLENGNISNLKGKIKDSYLRKTKELNCDYCFLIDSNIFIAPFTFKYLLSKDKPIIAPLLRPIPGVNSRFRNFFGNVNAIGYYSDHPDYDDIADRIKVGTFLVPCISSVYLINAAYVDQLSFCNEKPLGEYEWIIFSRNARKNNIEQYICNEKEFGKQVNLDSSNEREFKFLGSEIEINKQVVDDLLIPYSQEDPLLKRFITKFKTDEYSIYIVNDQDLFYIDEKFDFIKTKFLKRGIPWENHINALFKKYVRPNSIAIDIGGHIGTHTLNLSKLVGDAGEVHVFEPQDKIFTELVINMHINQCKNIKFHHKALGKEDKLSLMCTSCDCNEGIAFVLKENTQQIPLNYVTIEKLDKYNLNNVSFIKIDVEGFEGDVVQGAKETILRNKPTMIIEITGNHQEVLEKRTNIEKLGYLSRNIHENDFLFIPTN